MTIGHAEEKTPINRTKPIQFKSGLDSRFKVPDAPDSFQDILNLESMPDQHVNRFNRFNRSSRITKVQVSRALLMRICNEVAQFTKDASAQRADVLSRTHCPQ